MSKRKQSDSHSQTDTITIHDLWTSHHFLAPYDYSSATIGIHSYLLRWCENEHFSKIFHQKVKTDLQTKDFISQLNDKEKTLSNKRHLDIERCAIIARLRKYLEQDDGSFQNILKQIQNHLDQSMQEDPSLFPQKMDSEFTLKCKLRNEAAIKHQRAHRMRRLQFHDNNDGEQSMNAINLQNWILADFQLFCNIISKLSNHTQFIPNLETLLNNSFFIIQHPSPPIATHSPGIKDGVTAKVSCRLLCLLDRSNPVITIDNITPFVRRLTTYYQKEEADAVYQQPQMNWKTYSIVTTSNNYKTFSCADLSDINLKQISATSGKTHYAPLVYRIDFYIKVKIHFPNHPFPYEHCVILQSAPFGLISNTSQEEDVFARVFIEDLKSWRSSSTTVMDNLTPPPTTIDLTIEEIVDSIEHYFIHKTGIRPTDWVMPYIDNVLRNAYLNQSGSIESLCHTHLVKILAQIDYMTKHPLLSLFHADGLFLAICDDDIVSQILFSKREYCEKSICAIRFGAMSRMSDLKDIGVRIDLVDKSSPNLQKYKFDTTKLSFELGLYIIKIALCEASHFNSILTSLYTNVGGYDQNSYTNIIKFVELYHSEKLLEICPHETRYSSIWNHFYNNENNDSRDADPSTTKTTAVNSDNSNSSYHLWNADQTPSHYYQQLPLQPYYPQSQTQFHENLSNVLQYSIAPEINQTNINSPPIIIIVTTPSQCIMSNQDLTLLIKNHLPQYSQLIHSSPVYRFDAQQTFSSNSTSFEDSLNSFNN